MQIAGPNRHSLAQPTRKSGLTFASVCVQAGAASAAVQALVSAAIAGVKARLLRSLPAAEPSVSSQPGAAESAATGLQRAPPPEDAYVLVDQPPKPGLCFKVTTKAFAVAFEDGSWSGFEIGTTWETCHEIDVADVVVSNGSPNGRPLVEAYLHGKSSIAGWTLMDEYRHPPPLPPTATTSPFTTPRLPPLKTGDRVNCVGKVWSGAGFVATSGKGVTFVAIAQQKVKVSSPALPAVRHLAAHPTPITTDRVISSVARRAPNRARHRKRPRPRSGAASP